MVPTTLEVLESIHRLQPITRRKIAERTGLGTNRVGAIVTQLLGQGFVCEETSPDHSPGRPAGALRINGEAGRVVGLDIGGSFSRAVLADLTGHVIASKVRPTRAVPDRDVIVADLAGLVTALCEAHGMPASDLAALGIGVRGIVDPRSGEGLGWPSTPAWSAAWTGLDVSARLRSELEVNPVVIDDSVRAMGLCASRWGPACGSSNFLYVFLGTGIGSALFVEGRPYCGATGLAGEIGHVTVVEDGPYCSCGNRGCLEVLASTPAVLRRVTERLTESFADSTLGEPFERGELDLDVLIHAASAGDKIAYQVLDETGSYLGQVIATALNLFGPELVVLGGPLTQGDGIIIEAVRRQVRLLALQQIARRVRILSDDQGELAGARGAALLSLDALFRSPERLAALGRGVPVR